MSNLSQFFGSKGGGLDDLLIRREIITESQTWVAPFDLEMLAWVIGGGGTGGQMSGNSSLYGVTTGGGAGGLSFKKFSLKQGDSIICTVGSGGTAPSTNNRNGVPGGDSSLEVPSLGIEMLAKGGKGGNYLGLPGSGSGSQTLDGGEGGEASGGDFNNKGGDGSPAIYTPTTRRSTGGGSVGVYADGETIENFSAGLNIFPLTSLVNITIPSIEVAGILIDFPLTKGDPERSQKPGVGGAGSSAETISNEVHGGALAGGGSIQSISGRFSQSNAGRGGIGGGGGGALVLGTGLNGQGSPGTTKGGHGGDGLISLVYRAKI